MGDMILQVHQTSNIMNNQKTVMLTLAQEHWDRIAAALLSAAEDLAQVDNPDHKRYKHTYDLVKLGLER